mmetsp:Transcript_13447/g.31564  ORF Transcript_13447/g.31564 Transcript_13447/m.31564 type:complete len:315 (+) Transcript_13447:31-975(+)
MEPVAVRWHLRFDATREKNFKRCLRPHALRYTLVACTIWLSCNLVSVMQIIDEEQPRGYVGYVFGLLFSVSAVITLSFDCVQQLPLRRGCIDEWEVLTLWHFAAMAVQAASVGIVPPAWRLSERGAMSTLEICMLVSFLNLCVPVRCYVSWAFPVFAAVVQTMGLCFRGTATMEVFFQTCIVSGLSVLVHAGARAHERLLRLLWVQGSKEARLAFQGVMPGASGSLFFPEPVGNVREPVTWESALEAFMRQIHDSVETTAPNTDDSVSSFPSQVSSVDDNTEGSSVDPEEPPGVFNEEERPGFFKEEEVQEAKA